MKDFKSLKVWELSHQLNLDIYKATENFPKKEEYRLTSQIIRASYSISSNIAEGTGRGSDADFARFIQMSIGSASELEYFLLLAKDLKYLGEDNYKNLFEKLIVIKKMLINFIKKLKSTSN